MLKQRNRSLEELTTLLIERTDGNCRDATQLAETDDRIVAELDGIREIFGSIALSLAVLADNSVEPGIKVRQ